MADNVQFSEGTSGKSFKTNEVSTNIHVPYSKLDVGANGASDPVIAEVAGKVPVTAQGNVDHDDAEAGGPVKFGGKARTRVATIPADVGNGDRVDAWFDTTGALVTVGAEAARTDTTWTNGTALNTAVSIDCAKMSHVMIFYDAPTTGTITAGAFVFECSWDNGSHWEPISGSCFDYTMSVFNWPSATQAAQIGDWSVSNGWRIPCQGFDKVRVRVSTAITGTTTPSSTTTRTTTGGTVPTFAISIRATMAGHGGGHEVVRQGDPDRLKVRAYGRAATTTGNITAGNTTGGGGTAASPVAGSYVQLDLDGTQSNAVIVLTGTWSAGLIFQQSPDGTNWTYAI